MSKVVSLSRRSFLKTTTILGGGLVIAFAVPGIAKAKGIPDGETTFIPNAFLQIGNDDTITIFIARSEIGQGISTTLSMMIAEELDANWNKIKAIHAPVAPEYFHTLFGMQSTGGSTSAISEFDRYRQAGATARVLLVQAAAKRLGINSSDCRTENGKVITGQKSIRYGELVDDAAKLPTPKSVILKDPKNWKFIGKQVRRLDTPEKINGTAIFGIDIRFPGLLTAIVNRGPILGAKVKSFDAGKAKAIPGVRDVVQVPSGVAVLADDFWAAKLGRDALEIEWDLGPNANLDSKALLEEYRQLAATEGVVAAKSGNIDEAFNKAVKIIETEYDQPFLAQAPMEPLTCAVKLSADKCEIWTGTHTQTLDQLAAAKITGLKPEQVFINTVFSGGSFGRRNSTNSDFVREAVEIAMASNKSVKVVWTREDDIHGGQYRPAYLHTCKVGLDKNNIPIAWKHVIVGQSIIIGGPYEQIVVINGVDLDAVSGVVESPYLRFIPNHRVDLHLTKLSFDVGNWRSVGHSHCIFARESLIDEMAEAAGKDPVEYRRLLIKGSPRYLAVLDLAAKKAGWGMALPAGRGRGVALAEYSGSVIAQVAEISVSNEGEIKVHKVVCAIDCGLAINPDAVRAQVEGGIVFGLTAALYGEITFEKGKVMQHNFYDYRMLRMHEMPVIETYIVPSAEKPGGVGETSVPGIMPALANAVYAATGKRIRKLPIYSKGWRKS